MDESGHDHRSMPYEVRGGIAIHASKLWEFTRHVQSLERTFFGQTRHEFGSEIKGDKLLKRPRFKKTDTDNWFEVTDRKRLTKGFISSTSQSKPPRSGELKAYCESCQAFSMQMLKCLEQFNIFVFAAFVPPTRRPENTLHPDDYLRKDHVFLLERFYYFLEHHNATGILVMDGSDKTQDRRFVRGLERYFQYTVTGRQRAERCVPVPLFVESDMGYGVQVADLCIYCLNWAYRVPSIGLDSPTRTELEPFARVLRDRVWDQSIQKDGNDLHIYSVIHVPDPYEGR